MNPITLRYRGIWGSPQVRCFNGCCLCNHSLNCACGRRSISECSFGFERSFVHMTLSAALRLYRTANTLCMPLARKAWKDATKLLPGAPVQLRLACQYHGCMCVCKCCSEREYCCQIRSSLTLSRVEEIEAQRSLSIRLKLPYQVYIMLRQPA